MKPVTVMTIFGTRPEAIKMAPLALELQKRPGIRALCCVTAQHREMLDSVLEIFKLKPDYDLNIMQPRQTLSTITSKCLTGMDDVLNEAKPDLVLVHGDTSTTFAVLWRPSTPDPRGPCGRPGLRTYDKWCPLPRGDEPEDGGRHCRPALLTPPWPTRRTSSVSNITQGGLPHRQHRH